MRKQPLVGIDLGTTFSSLTCLNDDLAPRPVPNAEGRLTTPSVVFFPEDGEGALVGDKAIPGGMKHPERFIPQAKRRLGDSQVWEIDGMEFTPVDVSSLIVRKLLTDAAQQLGPITDAVITVPAHYTGYQRQLTIEAGKQAGLQRVDIVNEPVAAALSFALGKEGLRQTYFHDDSTILVYDLGGGTFDLSLVRYDRKQLRVLATSGEQRLGGMDWDQALVDFVCDNFNRIYRSDVRRDRRALRRLAHDVEQAKCLLSNPKMDQVLINVEYRSHDAEFEIDRLEFERLTSSLVQRTSDLTYRMLESALIDWKEIDFLIPVGGATHMPMIARLIESFAERGPKVRRISPELSIAEGAALFSGIVHLEGEAEKFGDGVMAAVLSRYRTTNVNANNLGIVILKPDQGHVNHILIPKNTPLPASANVVVGTAFNGQQRIKIQIVEGSAQAAEENKAICTCVIDSLPAGLPVNSKFDVNLMYDADGLIQVIARHRDSGRLATVSTLRDE